MTVIMDGGAVAETLKKEIRKRVDGLKSKGATPTLATILVGDEPSSKK